MIVRIKGINKVRAKGRIYYYHRATGTRLKERPGTTAFAAEIERIRVAMPDGKRAGTWGALVAAYRASPEYKGLAERTKSDYEKVFNYLAPLDPYLSSSWTARKSSRSATRPLSNGNVGLPTTSYRCSAPR
jgi:hypothetical protein